MSDKSHSNFTSSPSNNSELRDGIEEEEIFLESEIVPTTQQGEPSYLQFLAVNGELGATHPVGQPSS